MRQDQMRMVRTNQAETIARMGSLEHIEIAQKDAIVFWLAEIAIQLRGLNDKFDAPIQENNLEVSR